MSLQEAKSHLRIVSGDLDASIQLALNAAVDYCERIVGRSLRVSHTLVQSYKCFPCNPVRFDRQPVKAITSVTYYDGDGAQQTVSSSDYRLVASSDAAGFLEFDDDYSFPTTDDRADCVQITYTAGYADVASVPAAAKWAILLYLEATWGDKTPIEQTASERAVTSLLGSVDWGCYR